MSKIEEQCRKAQLVACLGAGTIPENNNQCLKNIAEAIKNNISSILNANKIDVENYKKDKPDATFLDRLILNEKRIADMVEGIRQIINLPDPVGKIVEERTLPNGLNLKKVRAPLGVIGVIYEARPNVTADVAALCIKSGNSVVLRGGSDAINSNREIYNIIKSVLKLTGDDAQENRVQFIDDTNRESSLELLKQGKYVDVVIPRGGNSLRDFVLKNATMPVIASGGGNNHIYIDEFADPIKAKNIVLNAKLQRPSVCNAMEHLIVHENFDKNVLNEILEELRNHGVEIIENPTEEERKTEFEELKMTYCVVPDFLEAIVVVNKYSTKHSDGIITENTEVAYKFARWVDSAAVYVNASTRFTDGFEFGLGAEIGISTQKLHVRGPIGLEELTSVKYVITGNAPEGNIRK